MRTYSFIAATLLTCAAATAAFAADLPTTKGVAPFVAPVFYNWSGCYLGANGGGLWVDKKWTDASVGTQNGRVRSTIDATGGLAGGQAGCNYQVDRFVFGGQVDGDWTDVSGSSADLFRTNNTDHVRVTSLESATARGAYSWDRFLAYVKGGIALETDKYSEFNTALTFTGDQNRIGGTGGLGLEYAVTDNLTAFAEDDYYDFGTRGTTLTGRVCAIGGACTTVTDLLRIRERKDVVKIGLNWKFDFLAPAPLVSKY